MLAQILDYLWKTVGIVGIAFLVWKASQLAAAVADIRDNDLPHLRNEVKELRQQFVTHLMWREKNGANPPVQNL